VLEQLKEFEQSITPGPWEHINHARNEWADFNFARSTTAVVENDRGPNFMQEIFSDEDYETKAADYAFAVFVRNNLPAIIEALEYAENTQLSRDLGLT
jgi:hypothetical protein